MKSHIKQDTKGTDKVWKEVTEGGVIDLYSGMQYYEQFIPEGSRAVWRFNLRQSLSPSMVNTLQQRLEAAGVKDVKVTTGSPVLNIFFTKGFPWLAIIVVIILVIAVLIISWKVLVWVEEVAAGSTRLIVWGALGIVGILLLGAVVKTKREFVAGKT